MGETALIMQADYSALCRAARIIAEGGVIAFPTDTVYGLACDLFNADAARRIYDIKGRPEHLPLIAMVAESGQWPQVAAALPDCARRLMQRWWPGPLTLILPARS
ncbi:MAG TPA: Sua5/YciO/YrdC/YwlC family protein, partial [Armatimonadota bacterium]